MREDLKNVVLAIERVPWSDISHAYGPAIDIPDLIGELTSADAAIRNEAWSELHGNLWHQGSIYEATAYAVPIFLELLNEPTVPGKHRILAYLALLFTGHSYWDVHQHLAIAQDVVTQSGFQTKLEKELQWIETTKEAVIAGRQIYLAALQSDTSETRIGAAYLLGVIDAVDIYTIEEVINAADEQ